MAKQENLYNNLPQYCIYYCSFLIGGMNMPSATVRISEEYRRQSFIEQANKAYLALRENPEAWETELKERREWEATLADNQSVNK